MLPAVHISLLIYPVYMTTTPEKTVSDLAHFAWCALIALRLAQRDGQALSPLTEHSFLVRWLAAAQKQRRFPRSVADDIESLLRLSRRKGPAAGLHKRLNDLFESCTAPVSQQSDLFRLVSMIEVLKAQGWLNATVDDHEWNVPALAKEYADDLALLVKKSDLVRCFADDGRLVAPIEFIVRGTPDSALAAFDAQAFRFSVSELDNRESVILTLLTA